MSEGGEARNHEADVVEAVATALDQKWVSLGNREGLFGSVGLLGERSKTMLAESAIAALDAARRSPEGVPFQPTTTDVHSSPPVRSSQGEEHDILREISKNAPLRERIADELAHNDECGPGPVSWQEYLADADAILRIVGEHGPQSEDHEARRFWCPECAATEIHHDWCSMAPGQPVTSGNREPPPSPVSGTEPRWIEPHDALKYELGDPMDDERVSGTEPDTARLVEALRRIADYNIRDARDLEARRIARDALAGFPVDAGKEKEER